MKKINYYFLTFLLFLLVGCSQQSKLDIHGIYESKQEVQTYLETYHHLPENYMDKKDAKEHGWQGGPLWKIIPNKSIGGDVFSNFEGSLPKAKGKIYYECDIDTIGASSRGVKRIIFSNDGDIYYTDNHYDTFTQLRKGEKNDVYEPH